MIGGARACGPEELAVGVLDGNVVDAGFAAAHESVFVELPLLVSVGAEPVLGGVVELVLEADGYAVVVEGPDFLDEAVVQFAGPFAGEELDDGGASLEEFGAVTPTTVGGVGERDAVRIATIPGVLGSAGLFDCGFEGEGRDGWADVHRGLFCYE